MPPGAVVWKLPPPQMRMVIQGKTPGQLCEQLKDPSRNGGKSLEQIIEHITSDKLVGWGWNSWRRPYFAAAQPRRIRTRYFLLGPKRRRLPAIGLSYGMSTRLARWARKTC